MATGVLSSQDSFSELFESDPAYLAALSTLPLEHEPALSAPGALPGSVASSFPYYDDLAQPEASDSGAPRSLVSLGKRRRLDSVDVEVEHVHDISQWQTQKPRAILDQGGDLDTQVYGASSFGGIDEYMSRKRAKLQIQNAELAEGEVQKPQIFKGIRIYVCVISREIRFELTRYL